MAVSADIGQPTPTADRCAAVVRALLGSRPASRSGDRDPHTVRALVVRPNELSRLTTKQAIRAAFRLPGRNDSNFREPDLTAMPGTSTRKDLRGYADPATSA